MESTEENIPSKSQSCPERVAFKQLSRVANELIIGQERLMERLVKAIFLQQVWGVEAT